MQYFMNWKMAVLVAASFAAGLLLAFKIPAAENVGMQQQHLLLGQEVTVYLASHMEFGRLRQVTGDWIVLEQEEGLLHINHALVRAIATGDVRFGPRMRVGPGGMPPPPADADRPDPPLPPAGD